MQTFAACRLLHLMQRKPPAARLLLIGQASPVRQLGHTSPVRQLPPLEVGAAGASADRAAQLRASPAGANQVCGGGRLQQHMYAQVAAFAKAFALDAIGNVKQATSSFASTHAAGRDGDAQPPFC